jgi:hypothetical protein
MNNQKTNNNLQSRPNPLRNVAGKAVNLGKKGVAVYQQASPLSRVIFFVVLILFLAFVIYVIYVAVKAAQNAANNSPVIVNDILDAQYERSPFNLPQISQGMSQSISTWIYVKDWSYKFGQYKSILWNGNPKTDGTVHSPSLWLYPLTNSLKVVTSTSVPEQVESCDIQNIPLMTWVHIAYILNNRTVDIYINGKLERSCALRGIPIFINSSKNGNNTFYLTTGNPAGYFGKIGKTQYFTNALLPNDVANLYQQGPLGTSQFQFQFGQNTKNAYTNGNPNLAN